MDAYVNETKKYLKELDVLLNIFLNICLFWQMIKQCHG